MRRNSITIQTPSRHRFIPFFPLSFKYYNNQLPHPSVVGNHVNNNKNEVPLTSTEYNKIIKNKTPTNNLVQKRKFTNIDELREAIFEKFVQNSLMLLQNVPGQQSQAKKTFECCDYYYTYFVKPQTGTSTTAVPPPPNHCDFNVPKLKRRISPTSSASSSAGGIPTSSASISAGGSPNRSSKIQRTQNGNPSSASISAGNGNGNGNTLSASSQAGRGPNRMNLNRNAAGSQA